MNLATNCSNGAINSVQCHFLVLTIHLNSSLHSGHYYFLFNHLVWTFRDLTRILIFMLRVNMMFNESSHLKMSSQQEHWFIYLEPLFSSLILGQITQSSWKGFSVKNWRLFTINIFVTCLKRKRKDFSDFRNLYKKLKVLISNRRNRSTRRKPAICSKVRFR